MSLPPSNPFSEAPRNPEGAPSSSNRQPYPPVLGAPGHPGGPPSCAPAPLQGPGALSAAASASGHLQPFIDTGERVLLQWGVPTAAGGVAAPAWGSSPALQQKQQQTEPFFPAASAPKDPEAPFGGPLVQGPLAANTEGPPAPGGPTVLPAEGDQWGPPVPQHPWVGGPPSSAAAAAAAGAATAAQPTVPSADVASQQPQQQQLPQQQLLQQQQQQQSRQQHALLGGEGVHGGPPGGPPSGVEFAAAEGKWQGRWAQGPPTRSQPPACVSSSLGFEGAPPLAEGPVFSQEGPLNPAAAPADFFRPLANDMPPHTNNYAPYQLRPEGAPTLQLRHTGPPTFVQRTEDPAFAGAPEEQRAAKETTDGLHGEGPQPQWALGAPGVLGAPGAVGAPGVLGGPGALGAPSSGRHTGEAGAAPTLDCGPPPNGPLRVAAAAQPPQQQQQQELQQLSETVGVAGMGALQRKGGPSTVSERQQQGDPGLCRGLNSSSGAPAGPWAGLPGVQSVVGGPHPVGAPVSGPPYMGGPSPPFLRGPNSVTAPQPLLRGAPRSSPSPLGAPPQGPPPDSLLSAVASRQYALLAVRAFLLACEEPAAPPWKQIAAWGPWLSGQQQGATHLGLQGPRRRGGAPQPAGSAVLTESEEQGAPAAEEGAPGGPPEKGAQEAQEEPSPAAANKSPAADEGPLKPDRKKKRTGAPQGGPPSKKATKTQRAAAGEGSLVACDGELPLQQQQQQQEQQQQHEQQQQQQEDLFLGCIDSLSVSVALKFLFVSSCLHLAHVLIFVLLLLLLWLLLLLLFVLVLLLRFRLMGAWGRVAAALQLFFITSFSSAASRFMLRLVNSFRASAPAVEGPQQQSSLSAARYSVAALFAAACSSPTELCLRCLYSCFGAPCGSYW